MLKRVLVYFKNETCSECILNFLKVFSEKYKCEIDGIYIKDIRKYEIIPAASEGIFVDFSTNYILKEWENYEKKISEKVQENFKKVYPSNDFIIEDGITPDIIREKMKGYDLLIMGITEKIDENLKSIMKTHYKPIFLIPSKSEYKLENIIFADDNGENSNKSIFKFMNCFENIENYKFISVNIENKSENLKKYMEIAGKKVQIVYKKGDETEIIIDESKDRDILIMGNLKHFFIYERLTGKVGLKLLQNSKIPIFIG